MNYQLSQIPKINWYRSRYIQQGQSDPVQQPWEERSSSSSEQSRSKRQGGQFITERLDITQPGVNIRQQYRFSGTGSSSSRSRLELSNIDDFDSGEYWCSVELSGVEPIQIIPSDTVYLREPAFYSRLGACSTAGALSKLQRKCAFASTSNIIGTDSVLTTTHTPKGSDGSTRVPTVKPLTVATGGSKPTSSLPNTVENADQGATTGGMSNPIKSGEILATTDESAQAEVVYSTGTDVDGSVTGNEIAGDNPTDEDSSANQNVLLELYVAIAVLVIFGVIIMILVPITVWMCFKKKKIRMIEGMLKSNLCDCCMK